MSWPNNPRPAKSLVKLRDQINAAYPNRDKASDGLIGDTAHAAQGSESDHNAWIFDSNGVGVVTAFDITHDPAHGLDIGRLSDVLADSRDNRIKYLIANNQILVVSDGWFWQNYNGADPHTNHIHISVNTFNYDDQSPWTIEGDNMPTDSLTNSEAQQIYNFVTLGDGAPEDILKAWTGKPLGEYLRMLANDPSIKSRIAHYKETESQPQDKLVNKLRADLKEFLK